MRILVVEDEISLANSLVRLLTVASYQAKAVHDGYRVAAALRKAGNDIPILMLTARETVADKVQGAAGQRCGRLPDQAPSPPRNYWPGCGRCCCARVRCRWTACTLVT